MPGERVLEVEQAEPGDTLSPADQHDIFRMVVAEHRHWTQAVLGDRTERILPGGAPSGGIEVEADRARAIARALDEARPGDVVLIAGKGHEQGQEVAGEVHPFDDRVVAREALRALSART